MQDGKISRVAVIGNGTIGASWAALFLARGLTVAASDPAPQAETALRGYVDTAWPALRRLGAADSPPQHRLKFHADSNAAVAAAEFRRTRPSANRSNATSSANSMPQRSLLPSSLPVPPVC